MSESPHVRITDAEIDPRAVLSLVGDPSDGAVLLFLGVVRDHNRGRPVTGLRYEAYREMALPELARIAREGAEELGTPRVAVEHRVGELAVGEVSVAIAVSSPHRAEAYRASRHIMEEIKKRLPVWKEERYTDGNTGWVEGTEPPRPGARIPRAEVEAGWEREER